MNTFSRSKKSTAGSVTSPCTSSRTPSCAASCREALGLVFDLDLESEDAREHRTRRSSDVS